MDFGSIGAGATGGAVVAIVIKATDEFSNTFAAAADGMGALGTAGIGLIGALGASVAVIGGMSVALGDMAIKAGEAGDVQEAFNRLAGTDGVLALQKMTDATLGTISQLDLMKEANINLMKGVDTESLPLFAKYAQQLQDMGLGSVTENMDSLSTAFSNGSPRLLKALGLTVDLDAAYKKYAESLGLVNDTKADELNLEEASIKKKMEYYESIGGSNRMLKELQTQLKGVQEEQKKNISSTSDFSQVLTEAQKKIADHAAITEAIATASKKLPEPTLDAADAVQQLSAAWKNMQIQIGDAVGGSAQTILTNLLPVLHELVDTFMTVVLPSLKDVFEAFGNMTAAMGDSGQINVLITALAYVVKGMAAVIIIIADVVTGVANLINIFTQWGEVIVDVVEHKAIAAFHLFSDSWNLTKILVHASILELELLFEQMANNVIKSLQHVSDTVTDWIKGIIRMYDELAPYLGLGQISQINGPNFSNMLFNTKDLESQIAVLGQQGAKVVNNINIDIQQLSGINPTEMAKALRNELLDLVSA